MKIKALVMVMLCLMLGVFVTGCGQRAANSQDAIEQSKAKPTVEAQVDYLVGQANGFVNSEEFDEGIAVGKYILSELDKNSEEAKSVIQKAKEKLKKMAEQKAEELKEEAKKKLGDVKGKLGSFGQ